MDPLILPHCSLRERCVHTYCTPRTLHVPGFHTPVHHTVIPYTTRLRLWFCSTHTFYSSALPHRFYTTWTVLWFVRSLHTTTAHTRSYHILVGLRLPFMPHTRTGRLSLRRHHPSSTVTTVTTHVGSSHHPVPHHTQVMDITRYSLVYTGWFCSPPLVRHSSHTNLIPFPTFVGFHTHHGYGHPTAWFVRGLLDHVRSDPHTHTTPHCWFHTTDVSISHVILHTLPPRSPFHLRTWTIVCSCGSLVHLHTPVGYTRIPRLRTWFILTHVLGFTPSTHGSRPHLPPGPHSSHAFYGSLYSHIWMTFHTHSCSVLGYNVVFPTHTVSTTPHSYTLYCSTHAVHTVDSLDLVPFTISSVLVYCNSPFGITVLLHTTRMLYITAPHTPVTDSGALNGVYSHTTGRWILHACHHHTPLLDYHITHIWILPQLDNVELHSCWTVLTTFDFPCFPIPTRCCYTQTTGYPPRFVTDGIFLQFRLMGPVPHDSTHTFCILPGGGLHHTVPTAFPFIPIV